ncbi:MarR family transcriptional regulator, partial [Streptomyces sp. NPDC048527]|uniref:MarR family transcriptional regulator n=1 Tax=Streptomyces sp. NPDC048527 TaxID=3365568 RepID=UPI0037215D4C
MLTSTARTLQKLEEAGLVERQRCAADRRAVRPDVTRVPDRAGPRGDRVLGRGLRDRTVFAQGLPDLVGRLGQWQDAAGVFGVVADRQRDHVHVVGADALQVLGQAEQFVRGRETGVGAHGLGRGVGELVR